MSEVQPSLSVRIRAAVRALPEPERAVFRLCAFDGLDYPEIADRFGITVIEVERLLATALLAIDRHLDETAAPCDPLDSGAKRSAGRLHRLVRWLGSV
jgi:DNA-directed RNA polymerase specialized sigma24 family protein